MNWVRANSGKLGLSVLVAGVIAGTILGTNGSGAAAAIVGVVALALASLIFETG